MKHPNIYAVYDRLCKFRRELTRLMSEEGSKLSIYERRRIGYEIERLTDRIRPLERKLTILIEGDFTTSQLCKNHNLDNSHIPKTFKPTLIYADHQPTQTGEDIQGKEDPQNHHAIAV